jgi:hypothetical protein
MVSFLVSFQWLDLFYAALTVVVTVFLIIGARVFGNLPVSSPGLDFNLLTYGFLWDTAIRAIRNIDYWPRFDQKHWPINKASTLVVIALLNLIFLAWNMKLTNHIEKQSGNARNRLYVTLFLKPFSLALGLVALIAFLLINSLWG